jgi:hypothetical protein
MKDPFNQSPQEDSEDHKNTSEKLDLKIEVAKEEDWEQYKNLRLIAMTSEDKEMLGSTPELVEKARARTDQEWKDDITAKNMFVMLSKNGSEAIGMGIAADDLENGIWRMGSGFVKPEFRNTPERVGRNMFAARLEEIKKRGGKKVMIGVKAVNATSIHIAESFGFKKREEDASEKGYWMVLDLTETK